MRVLLFGQPNSGKSALLARLTGARVVTSNYPGTTCEILSGKLKLAAEKSTVGNGYVEVFDTPGVYTLPPLTKDERVASRMLEYEPQVIVNVVDSTSLSRHLILTFSLLKHLRSRRIRVIVAVNRIDALAEEGLQIDAGKLARELGVPVVLTSAVTGEGIPQLVAAVHRGLEELREEGSEPQGPLDAVSHAQGEESFDYRIYAGRALSITQKVSRRISASKSLLARSMESVNAAMDRPHIVVIAFISCCVFFWGILTYVLPVSEAVFEYILHPLRVLLENLVLIVVAPGEMREILREAVPEGFLLPLVTVFPAMVMGYLSIAVLEDTGLLPRFAVLGDRFLSALNLPGQAVFPLILGLGCRVPGIIGARTMPTQAARKKVSLVICNLVPCTATLSLAWPCIVKYRINPLIPGCAILVSLFLFALIEKFLLKMENEPLVLEMPSLRMPILRNVFVKTSMRLEGFFTHVLPLVFCANMLVRLAVGSNVLNLPEGLAMLARDFFGVSPEALLAVLLTAVQRYLAPLFLLGLDMSSREATIALTMVVLGFPCLPSVVTLWRELGLRYAALSIFLGALLLTFWGVILNHGLFPLINP